MKKHWGLMVIVLVMAGISLFVYPHFSGTTLLSPEKNFYQSKFESSPKEAQENLCDGRLQQLMLGIGSCRGDYTASEGACSKEKDFDSCLKVIKEDLKECVMRSVKRYCPELLK